MERFIALFTAVVVVVIGGGLGALYYLSNMSERDYQRNTTSEQKAAHVAMAETLRTVTPGDILFMTMEFDEKESMYLVAKDPMGRNKDRIFINFNRLNYTPEQLGRIVTRTVRKTDADWPEVAKQFFAQ